MDYIKEENGIEWCGEVSGSNFILEKDLSELVGLKAGNIIDRENVWLKFKERGIEKYVAKNTLRNYISWEELNNINIVSGRRIVKIKGEEYIIRLMSGVNGKRDLVETGFDVSGTGGSEWNRLFYRIADDNYVNHLNKKTSEGDFKYFTKYKRDELILNWLMGEGSASWCMEGNSHMAIYRGGMGVSYYSWSARIDKNKKLGWRPVLEKIK